MSQPNIFVCPTCGEKNSSISNIYANLGVIEFNCKEKHKKKLEEYLEYLENLKGEKRLDSSQNSLIDSPIEDKMRSISDLIRSINLFLQTQEKHYKNYMNSQSIINIGESIAKEELYPNIGEIIQTQIIDKKNEEDAAIKTLQENYYVFIDNTIEKLLLKGKYKSGKQPTKLCLKDKGFKELSKIKFIYLTEINLACNAIKKVDYLKYMLLPHLELLNLSNNEIEDVKPVANLKSKNLRIIQLQDNKIKNLDVFNFSEDDMKLKFQKLEILRVDNNDNLENSSSFEEVKIKYGKKLIYKPVNLDYFNKKYHKNFTKKTEKWDLSDTKDFKMEKGILLDLYNLIGYDFPILSLYLDNNNIDNVALLSNISLYHLKVLDLSLNKLTSILFLRKLSKTCEHLEELYLNDNKISYITPFKRYINDFKKLKILTLKNNLFYETKNCCKYKICSKCCDFNICNLCRKKRNINTNSNKTIVSIKDEETREVFHFIKNNLETDLKNIEIEEEQKKETNGNGTETNVNINSETNANNNAS